MEIGAKQLGAGCPTGPAMPPGRRFSLGGAGASSYAPDLQPMLPVYRERHGGRGSLSGSISASVSDAGELSFGARRIRYVDDQRHAKPADRSLSPNQARPDNGFAGRCNAGGGEQRVGRTAARRAGAVGRVERASASGVDQAFAGVTRGGYFARLAATGLRGDSTESGSARGYRKVTNQPGTYRISTDFAADGSRAIRSESTMKMANIQEIRNYGKLAGGWL